MSLNAKIKTLIARHPVSLRATAMLAAIAVLAVLVPVGTETQGGGSKNPPTSLRIELQSPVS